MNNNASSDSVYSTLFPLLGKLFPDFQFRLNGDRWEATAGNTPCCHGAAAGHLYAYQGSAFGLKCHRCGQFSPLRKLVPGGIDALFEAAGLSRDPLSPEMAGRLQRHRLLERILKACTGILHPENAGLPAQACAYLKERGMPLEYALKAGYGVFPNLNVLTPFGITEPDLIEAGFTGLMMGRIVVPYKDADGLIIGAWGRVVPGSGAPEEPKYLYTAGLQRHCPYQLHDIDPNLPIIVVDGVLSTDLLRAQRIANVVAAGNRGLTRKHVEALKAASVSTVILFLDFDPESHAGELGTVSSLQLLMEAGIRSYAVPHWAIMDPAHPDQKVDPDSYLLAHGVRATQDLILNALHATRYLVQRQMLGKDSTRDLDRDSLLEYAGEILADTSTDGVEATDVLQDLCVWTKLPKEVVAERVIAMRTHSLERRQRDRVCDMFNRAGELAKAGKLGEARALIQTEYPACSTAPGMRLPYFDDKVFMASVAKVPDYVLKTGWEKLDRKVSVRSGELAIVSARPGQGKTAAACNILINALETEPTRTAIFFTFEIPEPFLVARLTSIRAHRIDHVRLSPVDDIMPRYAQRLGSGKSALPPKALETIQYFGQCGSAKRVMFINEPSWTVRQIYNLVAAVKQDGRKISVVVIDYVEMIPPLDASVSREQQIGQSVHELRVMANVLGVPVVLLSQQNRENAGKPTLQGLRYSGQLEQEASVVIGLWNEARQETAPRVDDDVITGNEEITRLEAHVLKNRYGTCGVVPLKFDMLTGLIAEDLVPYRLPQPLVTNDTGK